MPYHKNAPYFKLFANCMPVKGAVRSTVCDLHRGDIHFIPNDLYDIIVEYKNKPIDEVLQDYDEESHADVMEYFDFLEKRELGFWCNDPECYPDMDLAWDTPSVINNAIIDHNEISVHNYEDILQQLDRLGCKGLQIRFYSPVPLNEMQRIVELTSETRLNCLELYIKYTDEYSVEACTNLLHSGATSAIYVHSSPFTATNYILEKGYHIFHTEEKMDSPAHCGIISKIYFSTNINMFTEAQHYNTCLNRKISIDVNGDIKNCPSLAATFGNIATVKLSDIANNEDFKLKWSIKKDQISVCKDCEFRYVCTDCRAYTQNPEDQYSKPLKCSYNPYTATWEQ